MVAWVWFSVDRTKQKLCFLFPKEKSWMNQYLNSNISFMFHPIGQICDTISWFPHQRQRNVSEDISTEVSHLIPAQRKHYESQIQQVHRKPRIHKTQRLDILSVPGPQSVPGEQEKNKLDLYATRSTSVLSCPWLDPDVHKSPRRCRMHLFEPRPPMKTLGL